MKYLLITCFTLVLCSSTSLVFAQTLDDQVAQAKGLMMDVNISLNQLNAKIKEIKLKAKNYFSVREAIIEMRRKDWVAQKEIIDSRKEREGTMRLDEFVKHTHEKEEVLKMESALFQEEQEHIQDQQNFNLYIKNIEEKIKANIILKIQQQNNFINNDMRVYLKLLDTIKLG